MISLILVKSALMLHPIKKKNNVVNVFCSCKDANNSNSFMFPYTPFEYSKNNSYAEQNNQEYESESDEPEHISIDNLYLQKKGPEVIIDPYAGPDKDYYGPYFD